MSSSSSNDNCIAKTGYENYATRLSLENTSKYENVYN